jgi:hypothetical protein
MPDPAKRGLMLGGTIEIAPLHLRVSAAPFAAVWLDAANVADGWSISTALSSVRIMSGLPPIATVERTSPFGSFVPDSDVVKSRRYISCPKFHPRPANS